MLNSALGIFLYLLLPNHWSWARLSDQEKELIHHANNLHNTQREGYADPETYEGGKSFDTEKDRESEINDILLKRFLDSHNPQSVLELGPGSGYLTRTICTHPTVKNYTALDINPNFLGYLRPRLEQTQKEKPDFNFNLINDDFKKITLPKFDSIFLFSAVHHIPDRKELFVCLQECLTPGGAIFLIEPTHYLPRIWKLLKDYISESRKASYRQEHRNLSTHHFCTLGEFRSIIRQADKIRLDQVSYFYFSAPPILNSLIWRWRRKKANPDITRTPIIEDANSLLRWFSFRMAAVLREDGTVIK